MNQGGMFESGRRKPEKMMKTTLRAGAIVCTIWRSREQEPMKRDIVTAKITVRVLMRKLVQKAPAVALKCEIQ